MSGVMETGVAWVRENAGLFLALTIVLVVLLLLCWTRKSGFQITNPNPWNNWGYAADINRTWGGLNAGAYGSMWNPNSPSHNLPYDELQRIARYGPQMFNNLPAGASALAPVSGDEDPRPSLPPMPAGKEGFTSQQLAAAYSQPDQMAAMNYLRQGPCGYTAADAAIEVQALTSMGCYATYPYGVAEFNDLINQTDSLDSGLTPAIRNYQDVVTQGI